MSFLPIVELTEPFEPFAALEQRLGFVPNLFRAQALLPRVLEAEAEIAGVVLFKESALSRIQKESILLAVAAASRNIYCVTAHSRMLRSLGMGGEQIERITTDHRRAGLSTADTALLDFALKLGQYPTWISRPDVDLLRQHSFSDEQILEAVLMTALTGFLCTLSTGLGARPDFEPRQIKPAAMARGAPPRWPAPTRTHTHERPGAYLRAVDLSAESFAPFAFFRDRFGFVPGIFRAQTLKPDVLGAEARVVGTVLLSDDILSRKQKEFILLVVSAANLNTYCVAVHCEMLRALQVPEEVSDQIAIDHHLAELSEADTALLDFALKLSKRPTEWSRDDLGLLRAHGFSDRHILEAVVMIALTTFLNTLQMGLGTVPDFEPKRVFRPQAGPPAPGAGEPAPAAEAGVNLSPPAAYPSSEVRPAPASPAPDPDVDASLVARTRQGEVEGFEELVRRHQRQIYRTLVAVTGNAQDAEDATQSAFLKAYEHIADFRGDSKFSTWLTRIAINEGIQHLRGRKSLETLDEPLPGGQDFRPRDLRAWEDNPEQAFSRAEVRELVESELLKLPLPYRLAVTLRDIEQLSTEEAAAALGLQEANLKTRLLRGRLMLREALAPHFTQPRKESDRV